MSKIEAWQCDVCGCLMTTHRGYRIKGNLLLLSGTRLTPDNFPASTSFSIAQVKETVLCVRCFERSLRNQKIEMMKDQDMIQQLSKKMNVK